VIRLSYMVKRPRPHVSLSKREILRRDNYTCQYCGRQFGTLTLDHVMPRHRGGRHSWENIVAACPPCNRLKGGRTPREAGMPLKRPPREPQPSAEYLYGHFLQIYEEWTTYLKGW
jgi:5-methylcytosine-specific restriction endonuclease McrA